MENLSKTLGILVVFVGTIALLALILAFPIQWLWNSFLVGAISGVNKIGLFQAFAIYMLTSILFKAVNTNKQ